MSCIFSRLFSRRVTNRFRPTCCSKQAHRSVICWRRWLGYKHATTGTLRVSGDTVFAKIKKRTLKWSKWEAWYVRGAWWGMNPSSPPGSNLACGDLKLSFSSVTCRVSIFTLTTFSGKRNVSVWRSSVCPSFFSKLNKAHGAARDAASVHFRPTITRTNILVSR